MKSTALETFLFGVTCGIGITVLSLYAQKPGRLVTTIETIAEIGERTKSQRRSEETPEGKAERGRLFR